MTTPVRRHVLDVQLTPVLGSTFQPTGFPDLGAATFERPTGIGLQRCLLVESVQSMANHLEATTWDAGSNQQRPELGGLPYVEVRDGDGAFLTSSRLEAHRLFSAFIRDATWGDTTGDIQLLSKLKPTQDAPLDYPAMAREIVALDPFSLLHGIFFAGKTKADKKRGIWPAQPKFTRAISAVIEAQNVSEVASGGRKSDSVRHSFDETSEGKAAEGYGSVPFHRMEFTAEKIVASFVVDVQLLHSYGLPEPVTELLETLALWEIRAVLDGGLRLRTACDLEIVDDREIKDRRSGAPLPALAALTDHLQKAIKAAKPSLGEGKTITVTWKPPAK